MNSFDSQELTLTPQLAHEHTVVMVDDFIFQLNYSTLKAPW